MNKNEYAALIVQIADDNELPITDSLISKLAIECVSLEETDFLVDDLMEELTDVIPAKYKGLEEWDDLVSELANAIFDEIEEFGSNSEDE